MAIDIIDKNATSQVIGSLMLSPVLFEQDFNVSVTRYADIFGESFYADIVNVLHSLYILQGAKSLDPVTVDRAMKEESCNYDTYKIRRGSDYLINVYKIANVENFERNLKTVKKFAILRALYDQGICIDDFYLPQGNGDEKAFKKSIEARERLDKTSIKDIFRICSNRITEVEDNFVNDKEEDVILKAGTNMIAYVNEWKNGITYGIPYASEYLTQVTYGMRRNKFTLMSAGTGVGKSRLSIAHICHSFAPYYYDSNQKKWMENPYAVSLKNKDGSFKDGVLYIGTEMDLETEINPILIAYVADVPEEHIISGKYENGEEDRVKMASIILEKYSNIHLVDMPNYSIGQLKNTIQFMVKNYNVHHVFFDYIFTTPELIREFSEKSNAHMSVREDQVLLDLSTNLKNMCDEYDVSIDTWTQVNGDYKDEKNRDSSVIRGAKSIADKADVAGVVSKLTDKEFKSIETLIKDYFRGREKEFNHNMDKLKDQIRCYSIWKNRGGRFTNIKIWLRIDYGTMRVHDMFCTHDDYTKHRELDRKKYIIIDDKSKEMSDDRPEVNIMSSKVKNDIELIIAEKQKEYEKIKNKCDKDLEELDNLAF